MTQEEIVADELLRVAKEAAALLREQQAYDASQLIVTAEKVAKALKERNALLDPLPMAISEHKAALKHVMEMTEKQKIANHDLSAMAEKTLKFLNELEERNG